MPLPEDVKQRVLEISGDDAPTMMQMLMTYAAACDSSDRILRCLVHISKGSPDRLQRAIATAESDWRDTIMTAEYEPRPGTKGFQGDYIQVRDFNQPFA